MKHLHLINRILLGLVMLVPGLYKLWGMVSGDPFATNMLAGMGFPAPAVFAWILLLVEIVAGIAILARWKLHIVAWGPVVILIVAAFTTWVDNVAQILVHLALASSFLLLAKDCCRPKIAVSSMNSMKSMDMKPAKKKSAKKKK